MNYLSDLGLTSAPIIAVFILALLFVIIGAALAAVLYIIQAIGIYEMSVACGLKNPWYGFVPFFSDYAIGRLAEEHQRKFGKTGKKLKILLPVFAIVSTVLAIISMMAIGSAVIKLVFLADAAAAAGTELAPDAFLSLFRVIIPLILLFAAAAVHYIIFMVCLYRIFAVFNGKNAVLYTVLCVLFNVLVPILLFTVRKNSPHGEETNQFSTNFHFDVS